jgi:hypothetical protein
MAFAAAGREAERWIAARRKPPKSRKFHEPAFKLQSPEMPKAQGQESEKFFAPLFFKKAACFLAQA